MPSSGREPTKSRRKSLFALTSLTQIHPTPRSETVQEESPKTLKKRQTPSISGTIVHPDAPSRPETQPPRPLKSSPSKSRRPSLSIRPGMHRPRSSVFGSVRSMRSNGDDDTPSSTTSTKAPSFTWADVDSPGVANTRVVLHHGEVQTSSNMFRKKREYLVLTETHLMRCKSHAKASEMFPSIPPPFGRSPTVRHTSSHSVGSTQDLQSLGSDSSGDKEGRMALRQVVAIHQLDDGKPYFALEVCYLDEDSNQASAMTLQFGLPEERDAWLRFIRSAATTVRLQDPRPISSYNASYAARTVERAHDYNPSQFAMYKVVQRQSPKTGGRSSTDDLSKIASVVCFLAIGIHKVHLIPLAKSSGRTSSPSLLQSSHGAYGMLTLTGISVGPHDDGLQLTFRRPLEKPKTLYLASLASHDIALRLHHVDNFLRPECAHRLFRFVVPPALEEQVLPPVDSSVEEHCCLDRTLTAYCIAYEVNPASIRYTINYYCEDAPRFELLPIADGRRRDYHVHELLAITRALRYNESFGSISFADVRLDKLRGLHDPHGAEYVCSMTKRGTSIRLSPAELGRSSLLVQEIRALAGTSKKLRRLDLSGCINVTHREPADEGESAAIDIGCGIVEALFPLCRQQTTNVDWIALNGIILSDADLDYLVGAAVDRSCHFRALELSRCGLSDRTLGLIMDALRAQDNTLEALDISGNLARLSPAVFDSQISVFGFIRQLNLSHMSRTSGPESLLTAETLSTWRLEELRLSGTNVNEKTVEALASYLRTSQSESLHELFLDNAYLTGGEIATLMRAMHRRPNEARNLHLDISHNSIAKDYDKLIQAIAESHSPTHVTLRAMEYRDESILRHLLDALRQNHSTRYLDISRASLPSDAGDDTSAALERLFAENDTLEELDISGEDSRLEVSKFGVGLNRALAGLTRNQHLHVLRIQYQRLGFPGASILADVLKENTTLREVHCEHNEIPLSAFTDLVNALHRNTTIVYLPSCEEGRAAALKQTERQVKQIRDDLPLSPPTPTSPVGKNQSMGVRRGFATVKRSVSRSASSYTPSFPSLQNNRSTSAPVVAPNSKTRLSMSPSQTAPGPITAPLPQLSDQDVQAALRLVAESWDRQQYRLQQYLYRNFCILNDIPTNIEIQEEDFERPRRASGAAGRDASSTRHEPDGDMHPGYSGDLGSVLATVTSESTPRAEKELDFSTPVSPTPSAGHACPAYDEHLHQAGPELMGMHHFDATELPLRGIPEPESLYSTPLHGGTRRSPDNFNLLADATPTSLGMSDGEEVEDDGDDGLEIGLGIRGEEPRTPTQQGFRSLD